MKKILICLLLIFIVACSTKVRDFPKPSLDTPIANYENSHRPGRLNGKK